ncbi:hypothetical protein [Saccharothrix saharensis]|uniref:hypothetical protein n=1 Tax=Saccharothrix saharensis TaxID=571190 RepID=UPI0014785671|nr:hypothetical protein [Saccharothrix saharensis]
MTNRLVDTEHHSTEPAATAHQNRSQRPRQRRIADTLRRPPVPLEKSSLPVKRTSALVEDAAQLLLRVYVEPDEPSIP